MKPSAVTQTLYSQLTYRDQRQKILANNVANVNTPGYKTRDSLFQKAVVKKNTQYQLAMSITHKNHIPSKLKPISHKSYNIHTYEVKNLIEQNDGNNVDLDKQLSESSKNSLLFNTIASAIKKDSLWFKTVLEASSKN